MSAACGSGRLARAALRLTLYPPSRLRQQQVKVPLLRWSRSLSMTTIRQTDTAAPPSPPPDITPRPHPAPSDTKPSRRYNVGLVGAGRIARVHIQSVLEHRRLRLHWVADDDEDNVNLTRDQFYLHNVGFYCAGDVEDLLRDPQLDAVLVVSPTETHADLVSKSLLRGKGVFVEKPTAQTKEEIDHCYSLADRMKKPLLTGFQRRFDPTFMDLYKTVHDDKAVGKIFNIKTVSRDSPKPSYRFLKHTDPMGCNMLSDMAVHDVDTIVWLTDAELPESIYVITHAHDAELAETGVADTIVVVIKYKSGIIATIDSCRETNYGYDMRIEVFGKNGMVSTDHQRETGCRLEGTAGGAVRRLYNSFPQRFQKAFRAEIDHLVHCMDGTQKPLVTKAHAVMTALIVEKGVQSFRKKVPVYFDE